jgi:DNA invertase Pin-like site-specific DNA recombinase
MQIDAMRACAIQQHGTVADTVEEVASDATDQRPKRQVRLKAATQRQRDVMLVWKLDRSGHCLGDCMTT